MNQNQSEPEVQDTHNFWILVNEMGCSGAWKEADREKNMAQRFEKEICKPTMGSEFFLWTHVSC